MATSLRRATSKTASGAGTPLAVPPATRLKAFEAGWAHEWQGNGQCGYYIGRAHAPFTEVAVVKSTDRASADYLKPCATGEPGQLVTRGRNLMSGYVGNDVATAKALDAANGGWYTNLGDVGFCLTNAVDGGADLYWLSRDSAMLILKNLVLDLPRTWWYQDSSIGARQRARARPRTVSA